MFDKLAKVLSVDTYKLRLENIQINQKRYRATLVISKTTTESLGFGKADSKGTTRLQVNGKLWDGGYNMFVSQSGEKLTDWLVDNDIFISDTVNSKINNSGIIDQLRRACKANRPRPTFRK